MHVHTHPHPHVYTYRSECMMFVKGCAHAECCIGLACCDAADAVCRVCEGARLLARKACILTRKHGPPRVVCPQMLHSATAFNQDLSAWNVARVSNFYQMFDSATAFSGCNQRRVYDAWGETFKAAYPSFYPGSSCLSATGFSPLNAPASHSAAVTILGTGFGAVDASPSAYVSGKPCATTSWTSATQLICSVSAPTVAGGALPSLRPSRFPTTDAIVTGGVWHEAWLKVDTNTASRAFTFDGALLPRRPPA